MDNFPVLSDEADLTCRALMLVSAEWERARVETSDIGASGHPQMGYLDHGLAVLTQISRCVGLVEVFTFTRIMGRIDEEVAKADNHILGSLYKEKRKQIDSSWESVRKVALDWLGVDFKALSDFALLEAYIEARNSTMHASGRITRRQDGNLSAVVKKLSLVNISLDGSRLVVKPNAVRASALSCGRFVKDLDRET